MPLCTAPACHPIRRGKGAWSLARGWWPGGNLVTLHQDGSEQSPPVVSGQVKQGETPAPPFRKSTPHDRRATRPPCCRVCEAGQGTLTPFPQHDLGAKSLIYLISCSSPLSKVLGPDCPGLTLLLPRSSSFISLCLSFFTYKMERKILPEF